MAKMGGRLESKQCISCSNHNHTLGIWRIEVCCMHGKMILTFLSYFYKILNLISHYEMKSNQWNGPLMLIQRMRSR